MHAQFARKLRLTAIALGCRSRKALCARFRAVNPETVCDIDRLYKWMQGRAMPRGEQIFEDWRLVIGSDRHAAWIETSSVEDFAEELARRAGIDLDDLWQREKRQHRKSDKVSATLGAQRTLHGAFACYSHAWSPKHRGMLIRGALRIGPGPYQGLQAVYTEMLISGPLRLSGDVGLSGGMMHVLMREGATSLPLFLNLIAPGPPASVLCGVLAGPTMIAHSALPSTTRFVAVRVPDDHALDAGNRYIARSVAAIAKDLVGAGLGAAEAERSSRPLLKFLANAAQQVSVADQLALCDVLDDGIPALVD